MNKQNELNSFSVIDFSWKWRKPLLIVTILSGVLAFIIALFINPMYQSTAVVFAPQYNSFLIENYNMISDLKSYGQEHETEQLLQILNSRDLKDTLVSRFNLIEYYNIDTTQKHWKYLLYKELDGNIKVRRTQYGGILISVYDVDPDHAAKLANAMVNESDNFKNNIEKERSLAACEILKNQIEDVNLQMIVINDSVQKLANEGLFIYDLQVERVMQQYAVALGQGNSSGVQRLQKEIDKISKWGPTSVILRENLIYLIRRETQLKSMLWNAEMNLSELMPTKFVVEKAIPNDKKVYPKKLLIAFFSSVGAFITTFFVLLFMEKIKANILMNKKEE
ncbi:MAG: hypothetical protein LBU83_03450 [Bacteroidales bacterium]|jgi:uncharacterized protein involved in exopolysaccharide biosynthesis|nr:hypothetical protein [Bacteroidales bacterium]